MKQRLARLLLAYMTRLGLVLWAGDPAAALAPAGDPAPTGGDPVGAANDGDGGDADPAGDTRGNGGDAAHDDREKQIRKLERRIGTRTRALGERDARIAQLERELAATRQGAPRNDPADDDHDDADPAPRGTREPTADVEALAHERAVDLRRREKVAERTSTMLADGAKLDPKFRELALDVAADLPFVDRQGRPTEFIEEVLDTGKSADLLLHLARNPDAVESLQGLTGAKLGRRIEALVRELASATPKPSNLPKPLEPVSGRGNTAKAERAMSDEEWRAKRLKQRA